MEYDFRAIERKWQDEWRKRGSYKTTENQSKEKFYVLDMFPYPSGAGLHVGHPLGYIASDIYARFMRHKGYNVLHPMGYDSFGLPAEQYAIQTGQHPAITTENNIARYREQLDKIGFSYDWSREVRTSDPSYYKWTQWIFKLIYNSWFNLDSKKAESIDTLVAQFEANGNYNVNASINEDWYTNIDLDKFFFGKNWEGDFSATDWKSMNDEQKEMILMHYRLAYLADSWVNWCPALGTVLANDEVKDGVSERGGHPVEQKLMRQWSMRITAYAQRLLDGLDTIDWPESIKEIQRNWIGRSEGASVRFALEGHNEEIEVFTTRPDTIFGVSFLTLAPEHDLVMKITADEQRASVENYIASAKLKTERDRQSDVKNVSGQFTGAYAIHPFTGDKIPVWIGEYVLVGYGTGAVMAVPAGDQRDFDFAKKFELPIPNIFEEVDISEKAEASKEAVLANSSFLNGMSYKAATKAVIAEIEKGGFGKGKINYRMRDAVFSRQRYWGEPFPVYYKGELPAVISDNEMPVVLPDVDKYLPTESGEPPLARAQGWVYSLTPNPSPKERGTEGNLTSNTSVYNDVNDIDDFSTVEDANWNDFMEQEGHSKIKQWETANPDFWAVLKVRSKELRKSQTKSEEILWGKLRNRNLGFKFRRQHAISDYIVDFVCIEKRLVVEVDGGVHDSIEAKEYDLCRDNLLAFIGFKTIRFTNEQVENDLESCLIEIESILKERKVAYLHGNSTPLSFGEGEGVRQTFRYEFNTMPGWAGSSWYFLRYMDANNSEEFAARDKVDYWGQVDLYMGGAEHATGHLLYSRFWTKVLCDHGYIPFDEPFKKMINQGMILGRSSFVYRVKDTNKFVSGDLKSQYETQSLYADISIVDNDVLDVEAFKNWLPEYSNAEFILNAEGKYICGSEVEKMSKSKYNVQTPDELVEKFGADTLRCYEMFLGPVEQSKPWDTKGINGVHNFLRKMWRLYHGQENQFNVVDAEPTKEELKTLHKTIKKVGEDLQRFSWNTVVSTCMIGVNELTEQKCNKRSILEPLVILVAPYAPHIAEELWEKLGHTTSINDAAWPAFDEKHLQDDNFDYPISFNGKTRYFVSLPIDMPAAEVEKAALAHEKAEQYLEGKTPKKIIVVPKRIVNIVV
jgi:leucyl-tRNA synthetase